MGIPENQLDTWSHQGSITQSSGTYATIKRALEASDAKYADKSFEIFLQGSYGNDTNIYAESDVDVVIRLDSIFYSDIKLLSLEQVERYKFNFSDATYSYNAFKTDVIAALKKSFGTAVVPGNKAIKIKPNGNRRSADVIVAAQFRRYHSYSSSNDQRYDEGICFFTPEGRQVVNYPKQHSANCTRKHQATAKWYKPTVRIYKNMRSKLADDGVIDRALAPSYFVEGLLYNAPESCFGGSYEKTFVDSLNWLLKADHSKLVCANEQYYLLRDTPDLWSPDKCTTYLDALVNLWNDW